ncbi:protein IMPACT [Echinococcus multilocularis]|uniref:Protein IMPACT n=1 Tax=Echinococcus multilocularis TaxID=6211 RepID=A0A068YIK8_ECHMU|nr:protein IMPACT [Echinococcus multilocularis]
MGTQLPETGEFDITQQNDELQALESIYSDAFSVIDPGRRCYKISVSSDYARKYTVVLRFTFLEGYPSKRAPHIEISAPDLQKDKRLELSNLLNDLCKASIGSPVIYSMVETTRSFLEELSTETASLDTEIYKTPDDNDYQFISVAKPVYTVPSVREHLAARGRYLPIALGAARPKIYHGETIVDRKSVFQAHCCEVASLPEVSAFISTVLEDRKVAAASHNITAWYLQAKLKPNSPNTSLVADYDDDGEAQAGGRLLHLISMSAREGVAVMVSRWYGGIHIGPDRFKHINNAANQLLIQQGLTKSATNSGDIQTKARKRGKKD